MNSEMSCRQVTVIPHMCSSDDKHHPQTRVPLWPQRRPGPLMSPWSEEEECEAGERRAQLGRFGLTQPHLTTHMHTCRYMSIHTKGNVLFLYCPVALGQIRDARCQGMEHAGVKAWVTVVRKY